MAHPRGDGGGILLRGQIASGGEVREQGCGDIGQNPRHRIAPGRLDVERECQPQRGGGGGLRRFGEGEQFEQIQARHGPDAQALERGGRVHQQWRRPGAQGLGGIGGAQILQFAVDGQQLRTPDRRHNGGGTGQQKGGGGAHDIPFARSRPDSRAN